MVLTVVGGLAASVQCAELAVCWRCQNEEHGPDRQDRLRVGVHGAKVPSVSNPDADGTTGELLKVTALQD